MIAMPSPRLVVGAALVLLGLSAVVPAMVHAQAQPTPETRARMRSLVRACRSDFRQLCPDVQPGSGRILACLQAHAEALTPGCRQSLPKGPSGPAADSGQ